jgi:hypothetical protein
VNVCLDCQLAAGSLRSGEERRVEREKRIAEGPLSTDVTGPFRFRITASRTGQALRSSGLSRRGCEESLTVLVAMNDLRHGSRFHGWISGMIDRVVRRGELALT